MLTVCSNDQKWCTNYGKRLETLPDSGRRIALANISHSVAKHVATVCSTSSTALTEKGVQVINCKMVSVNDTSRPATCTKQQLTSGDRNAVVREQFGNVRLLSGVHVLFVNVLEVR